MRSVRAAPTAPSAAGASGFRSTARDAAREGERSQYSLGGEVAPTLLAAICREEDPAAFGCMNAALAAVLAQAAPAGDYGDAEARARICEEWRSRCGG